MKLESLKFDTPNNAAISLAVIAEKVRVGDVKVFASMDNEGMSLRIVPPEPMPEFPKR
jgi:hypothetical protein